MRKNIVIFILLVIFSGCDLFKTRTPEEPTENQSTYQPATSAQIVILNFVYAIKEKNVENYLSCLYEEESLEKGKFTFIPAGEVAIQYPNIFDNWDKSKERQYFVSLISQLAEGIKPTLILSDSKFEILLPDSAVYVSSYDLSINHSIKELPQKMKGIMQLTMNPDKNGIWRIKKWVDFSVVSDSTNYTWSLLKAMLSN